MIPYKFFDLTARDATGVLLSNIHRQVYSGVVLSGDLEINLFTVPDTNAFLLTSFSIEVYGTAISIPIGGFLRLKDKQGNTLSNLALQTGSIFDAAGAVVPTMVATCSGSPIAVIGPNIQLVGRGLFTGPAATNAVRASINGVLIPRGTMAYQT